MKKRTIRLSEADDELVQLFAEELQTTYSQAVRRLIEIARAASGLSRYNRS